MLAAFLLPYPFRGHPATYLWYFYKLVSHLREPILFICSKDYTSPKSRWEDDDRWELKAGDAGNFNYSIPDGNQLSNHVYEFIDTEIFEDTLARLGNNYNFAFDHFLTLPISGLENIFHKIFEKYENIEAVLTLCNCQALTTAAAAAEIPVIHNEIGPLRNPLYRRTAYFDFRGVNGNTEAADRYLLSDWRMAVDSEKLQLFFLSSPDKRIESRVGNSGESIGIALQVENDTNLLAYGNGFSNQDLLNYALNKHFNERARILARDHPGSYFSLRSNFVQLDESETSLDFVGKCELIYTINSSVGFEALLDGKNVVLLGESPFKFILDAADLAEFKRRLTHFLLCYLVPFDLIAAPEYIRFRLRCKNERIIALLHLAYFLCCSVAATTSSEKVPPGGLKVANVQDVWRLTKLKNQIIKIKAMCI